MGALILCAVAPLLIYGVARLTMAVIRTASRP